jgi:uncharacterized repeat protein (TIGR01451 family)
MKKQLLLSLFAIVFTSIFISYSQSGFTCNDAIAIPLLPYQTTDDTANYADTYDINQPASCIGTSGNYMGGNDVFYSYTPTSNEVINIKMSPNASWSGIFVYDGCANLGISCLAGVANGNSALREIPQLAVLAGHTYIITISTFPSPQTVGYNLEIQNIGSCLIPTSLSTSNITDQSATVSWTNTTSASTWEVAVVLAGSAAPSSGTTTNTNSNYSLNNLVPNTAYRIYVRTDCGNGTFSSWSSPALFSTTPSCATPTLLSITNISNNAATATWADPGNIANWEYAIQLSSIPTIPTSGTLTNSTTVSLSSLNNLTSYKLYIRAVCNNLTYSAWSIPVTFTTLYTPVVSPLCGQQFLDNGGLSGNYANNANDSYTICPTNPGEVVTVTFSSFEIEANFDGLYVYNGSSITSPQISSANLAANIPGGIPGAYWGTTIPGPFTSSDPSGCLTFRFRSDNFLNKMGWNANVECLPMATCTRPSAPIVTGITGNNATVSWTENGNAIQWEVLVLPATSAAPLQTANGTSTTINPFQLSGLLYSTAYKVYVKSICGTNDSSYWSNATSFTTNATNCLAPTNSVINSLTGTSANLSWIQNGNASLWEVYLVTSGSPAPTINSTGILTPTNSYQATGLTTGTAYTFYVRAICSANETSNWSTAISFTPFLTSPPIVTNTTQYSVNQLVSNVLINNPCINVSNISSISGENFGMPTGIGYFTNTNPSFPITSGLILSTGNALNAHGPNTSTLSDGTSNWPGDASLYNYINSLGIDPALSSYNNASVVEFDFSSLNSYMSFNFLFASDEYGTFQCDYTDAFAFFLTDLDTGTTTNLAVIPGTSTPVSVVTIRDGANNVACTSVNPAFFDNYTAPPSSLANGASTNFNGQTVKMTASSTIIPNHNYHIKLVIADRNDSAFDSAVFIEAGTFASGPPECSDKIELVAFIDENSNGVKDTNEVNFTYGSFTSLLNNAGNITNISSPFGTHSIFDSNPINVYDFGFQIDTEYAPYYTLGTLNYDDINIPVGNGTQTLFFPITLTQGYNDVSVTIVPIGVPRPGFNYVNKIVYKNLGIVATSGTLTFDKDPNVTLVNLSQNGTTATSSGFTYNFTGLEPYETRYLYVTMAVPTTVALGDLLTNYSTIAAASNDINLTNNSHSSTQTVVASYDPNDKMESHGEKIQFNQFSQNDYLYYTIRFQNNGTANAINIRIEDFLDARIDEQSIRVVNASHNYIMERVNNKITWNFNYIQLPSFLENADLCKGYVTFKVKLKPGFAIGDIIPNTASIYFDNNSPIITNTFNTEFTSTLANTAFNSDNFMVYPNPASSLIQISLQHSTETLQNITIYDVLGKSVKEIEATNNEMNIDISTLSKGVYLVQITTESNLKITKKLVIN